MKRLIKRLDEELFYAQDGSWTSDVAQAKVFPSRALALQEQQQQGWTEIELYVLQHDRPSLADIVIPMPRQL